MFSDVVVESPTDITVFTDFSGVCKVEPEFVRLT